MRFYLDSLQFQLIFTDPDLIDQVNILFQGWQTQGRAAPNLLKAVAIQNQEADCIFEIVISDSGPLSPAGKPVFQEKSHLLPPDSGFVSIFQQGAETTIYFHDGATIQLTPDPPGAVSKQAGLPQITATITRDLLRAGRLEDILFAGLAPFLRRKGYFLVHAFAAAQSGQSVLLVGPSNSGKTTAGLSLTCGGWGYLANDVVLLKVVDGKVCALPTPGALGLSAQTVNLIPGLESIPGKLLASEPARKKYLPALDVVSSWTASAPVRVICFPKIDPRRAQQLKKISKAMTFAKLMESSTDRWDRAMLEDHVDLMQRLIEQAHGYELCVGDQVADWPELLAGISD